MSERRPRAIDQLPWPTAWTRDHRRLVWLQRFGAVGGSFFFIIGTVDLADGPPYRATSPFSVLLGSIVLVAVAGYYQALNASPKRGSMSAKLHSVRSSANQMVFAPYTRVSELIFLIFVLVSIVLLLTFPQFADDLATAGGDSGRTGLAFFAEFGPYLTVLYVPHVFSYFIRGRRRMGLGLSPDGIYHWSWFGCVFTPWEKLRYVMAASSYRTGMVKIHLGYDEGDVPYDRSPEENWLGRFSKFRDSLGMTHVNAGYLTIHPALAYWALTFYFEHPEHRAELGTQAAIDRFRKADFPYPGKHDPGQLPRFRS